MASEKAGGRCNARILNAKDGFNKMFSSECCSQHGLKIARTFQTVAGVLCAVLCIVGTTHKAYYSSSAWTLFTGLLIFILTGIVAAVHNYQLLTKPTDRVYIVMSFISAIYSTIMMIITSTDKTSLFNDSVAPLHSRYCDIKLFGRRTIDVLLAFVFLVEFACGITGATAGYCASRRSENVQKQCPQPSGNTPLDEKHKITQSAQECDTLRASNAYAMVIIHKEDENDIETDIVTEGKNDEYTLQPKPSGDKHDKNEAEANAKTREGAEADYMPMTGHCDSSDYEVMRNVTYENPRLGFENDIENDIVTEGKNDEYTLQPEPSGDKRDKNEAEADAKTREGAEADYMPMTGHCDSSDYEVMRNVTYENPRLVGEQDNSKDEGFAHEKAGEVMKNVSYENTRSDVTAVPEKSTKLDGQKDEGFAHEKAEEVMKNVTYENTRSDVTAVPERSTNQGGQNNSKDEGFAHEKEEKVIKDVTYENTRSDITKF